MKITNISTSRYFFFRLYLFIGCGGSSLLHIGLPLVVVSEGYSLLWYTGFSFPWIFSCGAQAPGAQASLAAVHGLKLWHMGLVVPQHVGSSLTRYRICVPCIGRQILIDWTMSEAPVFILDF